MNCDNDQMWREVMDVILEVLDRDPTYLDDMNLTHSQYNASIEIEFKNGFCLSVSPKGYNLHNYKRLDFEYGFDEKVKLIEDILVF
jgi:hypothetical protein